MDFTDYDNDYLSMANFGIWPGDYTTQVINCDCNYLELLECDSDSDYDCSI